MKCINYLKQVNLLAYSIIIFWSSLSISAPNIDKSQPSLNGTQIKLSGSGFKSNKLEFEFTGGPSGHIESSPLGTDKDFGQWLLPSSDVDAHKQIVNDPTLGKVWFMNQPGTVYNATIRYDLGKTISENEKVYVTWMSKRRQVSGAGQWKNFRLSYENDIQDDGGEMVFFKWSSNNDYLGIRPETSPEGGNTTGLFSAVEHQDAIWYRTELTLKTSTAGVKDGHFEFIRLDGNKAPLNVDWAYSGEASPKYPNIMTYNSDRRYRWFIWQNYRGNGLENQEVWMDDIFIQVGSYARIELGNHRDYDSATMRAVQKPLAWSDNEIDFEVNLGGLSASDDLYIYVVDEDGVNSKGIKFSLSEATFSEGSPPSAPSATIKESSQTQ